MLPKLTLLTPEHLPAAISLYESAFPEVERRKTEDWVQFMEYNPLFMVCVITTEGHFCGFVSLWHFHSFIYIEHFALCTSVRGKGLGGAVLDEILRAETLPIVLEVEPPENDTTRRRIGFYQRHGFCLSELEYIQPPYCADLPSVPLRLMTTDNDFLTTQHSQVVQTLYRNVYGVCDK